MKKIFAFILLGMVSFGTGCAQQTGSAQASATAVEPLTVIVMDSTQALLCSVPVVLGTDTFYTALDGRVLLPHKADSISVSGERFAVNDASLLLVKVKPQEAWRYPSVSTGVDDGRMDLDYIELFEEEDADKVVVTGYGSVHHATLRAEKAAMPRTETVEVLAAVEDNNVSAGRLTAGEVNDFAKWYFWPTVIDSTHKAFIPNWKIAPRQRFTVQIKNQAGYPIANYPVNLTDRQGNTLFQAVTDNTGKAELWGNLVESGKSKVESFLINGSPAKEWQTIIIDDPCESPEGVDVMFVFDATGSMGDELRYLQAEMKDVISRAQAATGGLAIRTGAVVYRDYYDEYLTRISRLSDDVETTKSFIDQQYAGGGGDYPEAMPEALMAAINCAGWDDHARARIAFLILDAPCHQDSATIALLHDQILNAAAQGIRIVPVVCSGLEPNGELLMRSIALATNGTSFFLTDDSGIGHTHLKPTTDSLKVEHLNDMLVRTIVEFSTMPECNDEGVNELTNEVDEAFIPNPFDKKDLEQDPSIPHGEGVHYLVDVTGKLLGIYNGEVNTSQLPIGVYFIKTFYDGKWHTRKILVK